MQASASQAATGPQSGRRSFFKRRKSCPFSSKDAPAIDYKNVNLLKRFVTERGKIIPSRISAVSTPRQRDLTQAIKRARFLALLPYCDLGSHSPHYGGGSSFGSSTGFSERAPAAAATPAVATETRQG